MTPLTHHSIQTNSIPHGQRDTRQLGLPIELGADLLQMNSQLTPEEARVLAQARAILLQLPNRSGPELATRPILRQYLTTLLASQDRELFTLVALDNRHRVIASEILFAGTINTCTIYTREVMKCALRHKTRRR